MRDASATTTTAKVGPGPTGRVVNVYGRDGGEKRKIARRDPAGRRTEKTQTNAIYTEKTISYARRVPLGTRPRQAADAGRERRYE